MDFNSSLWFVGKLFFLFGIGIYVVFAIIVVRQVYLMTSTVIVGFETPIRMLVWVHLAIAAVIFLFVVSFL